MGNTHDVLTELYSAFNRRNLDGALSLMTDNVDWPKASEGGRVIGREEVQAYWTRQWAEFDPHVEPIEVAEGEAGKTDVKVHQIVKNLHGDVLSDQIVLHVYVIENGLVARMDVYESEHAFQHNQAK